MSDPQLSWHLARAAGLVAWWLLAGSVFLGLALSTRVLGSRATPAWLLDAHRYLGGLSVAFVAVHLGGLWLDTYVRFGWRETLLPLASQWHPWAVTYGVVALYLLVAVELTSLLLRWLPRGWWRTVHASTVLLFATASLHGITAGTDRSQPAVRWSLVAMGVALLLLLVYRQLDPRRRHLRAKAAGRRARGSLHAAGEPPLRRPETRARWVRG